MEMPAVVRNDRIIGSCVTHTVPGPGGAPMPAPAPLPFSAPLTTNLATTVVIQGAPAAVRNTGGRNSPPHAGLHPGDPFSLPDSQQGRVVGGSATVYFDGAPAAYSGCPVTTCAGAPAQVSGSATSVLVTP